MSNPVSNFSPTPTRIHWVEQNNPHLVRLRELPDGWLFTDDIHQPISIWRKEGPAAESNRILATCILGVEEDALWYQDAGVVPIDLRAIQMSKDILQRALANDAMIIQQNNL